MLLEIDADGDTDADGDWLYSDNPSSISACPHVRLSIERRTLKLAPNLNDPRMPRSVKSDNPPEND